jgi:hypothetical protein
MINNILLIDGGVCAREVCTSSTSWKSEWTLPLSFFTSQISFHLVLAAAAFSFFFLFFGVLELYRDPTILHFLKWDDRLVPPYLLI